MFLVLFDNLLISAIYTISDLVKDRLDGRYVLNFIPFIKCFISQFWILLEPLVTIVLISTTLSILIVTKISLKIHPHIQQLQRVKHNVIIRLFS